MFRIVANLQCIKHFIHTTPKNSISKTNIFCTSLCHSEGREFLGGACSDCYVRVYDRNTLSQIACIPSFGINMLEPPGGLAGAVFAKKSPNLLFTHINECSEVSVWDLRKIDSKSALLELQKQAWFINFLFLDICLV
jgi:hypothetical protein